MKTRSKSRVRQKATRKAISRQRPRPSPSKSAKALDLALKQLKRAVGVTVSRADSVLESTEAIANLSGARTKSQLLRSLLDDEVLSTLYGLSQNEDTSSALRMHSRWLREHFAVEPIYEQGQELEVPEGRLAAFDLIDGTGQTPRGICAIKILAVGWKQGNKVLRKPVASIIDGAADQGSAKSKLD